MAKKKRKAHGLARLGKFVGRAFKKNPVITLLGAGVLGAGIGALAGAFKSTKSKIKEAKTLIPSDVSDAYQDVTQSMASGSSADISGGQVDGAVTTIRGSAKRITIWKWLNS